MAPAFSLQNWLQAIVAKKGLSNQFLGRSDREGGGNGIKLDEDFLAVDQGEKLARIFH